MRGKFGPMATARNGEAFSSGIIPSARSSQPSSVAFTPGVPDSMKSCASKCEQVGIRRTGGMHNGQLIFLEERRERRKAWVQAERIRQDQLPHRFRHAAVGELRCWGADDSSWVRRRAPQCSGRRRLRVGRARRVASSLPRVWKQSRAAEKQERRSGRPWRCRPAS